MCNEFKVCLVVPACMHSSLTAAVVLNTAHMLSRVYTVT